MLPSFRPYQSGVVVHQDRGYRFREVQHSGLWPAHPGGSTPLAIGRGSVVRLWTFSSSTNDDITLPEARHTLTGAPPLLGDATCCTGFRSREGGTFGRRIRKR